MTREAFLKWAIPEYTKWMASNQGITPSLDRTDATKHYELGNLRVISRSENARLARNHPNVHAPEGFAWCHVCAKYLPKDRFWKQKSAFNGLQKRCRTCQAAAIEISRHGLPAPERELQHH